ncbi:MAG: D-2-hydroxyacid dehydrogenase [Vicinamibacterales bacterium]
MTILVALYSSVTAWNIPLAFVERLRREFAHHTFLHAAGSADVDAMIPQADVAYASELREQHFRAAPHLRWVHSSAAGVGGMLTPTVVDSPLIVTNSRGMSGETIAEHVLALALALFRKFPLAFRSQTGRRWAQEDALQPPAPRTIKGSRVLVVGLGGIGAATAMRFAALGAEVTAVRRRTGLPLPEGVSTVVADDALMTALPSADIVVLTAPETRNTRALIGHEQFEAMKADAILINVSRGKLIDEPSLINALRRATIGGAGLDVFEHEPLAPDSDLWELPNVIITPHVAGFRADHWDAATAIFGENLRRFDRGAPLLNVVDKTEGY